MPLSGHVLLSADKRYDKCGYSGLTECFSVLNSSQLHVAMFFNEISVAVASNVTSITEVRSASARLFASMWRPLVTVTTLYYLVIIFHRRVWKLSSCYACIQSSGIILIP